MAGGTASLDAVAPAIIVQNLEAGGSVAITRAAYERVGGLDEGFVGWGGEDNEFWERAQTVSVWPYGYVPLIHLWHAPQPEKLQQQAPPKEYYRRRAHVPPRQRIAELCARNFGNPQSLDPPWVPARPDSGMRNG